MNFHDLDMVMTGDTDLIPLTPEQLGMALRPVYDINVPQDSIEVMDFPNVQTVDDGLELKKLKPYFDVGIRTTNT